MRLTPNAALPNTPPLNPASPAIIGSGSFIRPMSFYRGILGLFCSGMGWLGSAHAQIPAEISFGDLVQTYNAGARFPTVYTNPGGLAVELAMTPRVSETVYRTAPDVVDLSYESTQLGTYKAIGDIIRIGGANRVLESVDVVFVTWAKASDWPVLAALNSAGYMHPLSLLVYRREANGTLTLLDQKNQETLIPWRPETLGDGTPYPYGGHAFNVRFNFPEGTTLSDDIAIMIGYNTRNGGFSPIGAAGPYDTLNIALSASAPSVGTDIDRTMMLRYGGSVSLTTAYGSRTPMLNVRAFPASPPEGVPINAGHYRVTATVVSPGYSGTRTTDFTITKAPAAVTLSNLIQGATGAPRPVTVATSPAGLNHRVMYSGQETPPSAINRYPVIAVIDELNYAGTATGTLVLGRTFGTFMKPWIDGGLSLAGPLDDPDHDGLSNLLEYALGTDPDSRNGTPPLTIVRRGGKIVLGFRRQASAVDIDYEIQRSPDLASSGPWTEDNTPIKVISSAGGVEEVEMELNQSVRDFFRLVVTQKGSF